MIKIALAAAAAYLLFWRKPAAAQPNNQGGAGSNSYGTNPPAPAKSNAWEQIFAHKGPGVFALEDFRAPSAELAGGDPLIATVKAPTIVIASLRAMQISYGIRDPQVAIRLIGATNDAPAFARVILADSFDRSARHSSARLIDGTGHFFQVLALHRPVN